MVLAAPSGAASNVRIIVISTLYVTVYLTLILTLDGAPLGAARTIHGVFLGSNVKTAKNYPEYGSGRP
jgi:hypothetical protein